MKNRNNNAQPPHGDGKSAIPAVVGSKPHRKSAGKKQQPLIDLIVNAGLARTTREAQQMLIDGKICHTLHGHEQLRGAPDEGRWTWQHAELIRSRLYFGNDPDKPFQAFGPRGVGTMPLYDTVQILHRNQCPECRKKPLEFTAENRIEAPPAGDASPLDEKSFLTSSGEIKQEIAERWFLRRRGLDEIEVPILMLLSKGAHFEKGIHSAELVTAKDETGACMLKLVIR